MPRPLVDRERFLEMYHQLDKSPARLAKQLGTTERKVHARLQRIEKDLGAPVRDGIGTRAKVVPLRSTRPTPVDLQDGVIVVGSDAHYWPGEATTAHRAMVALAREMRPDIVVLNGDEYDGAALSRHSPIGWEQRPSAKAEMDVCRQRMDELIAASPGAQHLATYGNHTLRFDTYLASHAAAVEGIGGTRLEDHFPGWDYRWAYLVNGHTLIKHRIRGGVHATWNNTADTHLNTVTGHCHALQVRPRTTMSPLNGGTVYGVDTGMLADPWGPQFTYVEQGPRNWRAGFAVLTFRDGVLMPPELAQVVGENEVFFRGDLRTF